jgi:hypothetical protein
MVKLMRSASICLATCFVSLLAGGAEVLGVNVPGSADPWLAGMPDGSMASSVDVAPAQSPVEVLGLPIVPETSLRFFATGLSAYGPTKPLTGPDGSGTSHHAAAAENGISDVGTHTSSLLGVFLGAAQPDLTLAPAALDFTDSGNVLGGFNYTTLSPLLKQVFFIGDGMTDGGQLQRVVVPAGATRLFLGTMDGFDWSNNIGSLDVQVTSIPEPSTLTLAAIVLLGLMALGRRRV